MEEGEQSVALTLYTYHRIAQPFHSAGLLSILDRRRLVFSSSISSWRFNPREPSWQVLAALRPGYSCSKGEILRVGGLCDRRRRRIAAGLTYLNVRALDSAD